MNDSNDAPVTRPDLDALAEKAWKEADIYSLDGAQTRAYKRVYIRAFADAADALASTLAAERARADQAASEAVREYAQALEHNRSAEIWGWSDFVRDAYEWSDWKSAAPAAEQ